MSFPDHVFFCRTCNRFRKGHKEDVEVQYVDRSCSSKSENNISQINDTLRRYRRLNIKMIVKIISHTQ